MTSKWGWTPAQTQGVWGHGATWLRPVSAAAPYLTVLLLLLMLYVVSGTLASATGLLFDLPGTTSRDGAATELVALILPREHETLAFFDDSRYILGDESSFKAFGESITARAEKSPSKTLLVLADRRVPVEDLMKIADVARRGGVSKVLFAGKNMENAE